MDTFAVSSDGLGKGERTAAVLWPFAEVLHDERGHRAGGLAHHVLELFADLEAFAVRDEDHGFPRLNTNALTNRLLGAEPQ